MENKETEVITYSQEFIDEIDKSYKRTSGILAAIVGILAALILSVSIMWFINANKYEDLKAEYYNNCYTKQIGQIAGVNELVEEQGFYGSYFVKLNDNTYISAYLSIEQFYAYGDVTNMYCIVMKSNKADIWIIYTIDPGIWELWY